MWQNIVFDCHLVSFESIFGMPTKNFNRRSGVSTYSGSRAASHLDMYRLALTCKGYKTWSHFPLPYPVNLLLLLSQILVDHIVFRGDKGGSVVANRVKGLTIENWPPINCHRGDHTNTTEPRGGIRSISSWHTQNSPNLSQAIDNERILMLQVF